MYTVPVIRSRRGTFQRTLPAAFTRYALLFRSWINISLAPVVWFVKKKGLIAAMVSSRVSHSVFDSSLASSLNFTDKLLYSILLLEVRRYPMAWIFARDVLLERRPFIMSSLKVPARYSVIRDGTQ